MGDSTFYQRHCIYLPAILGWFACSAALTSYNKVVFGDDHGAFPCPLLFTSMHFLVQWMFSFTASSLFPDFFGGEVVKDMSWTSYLCISLPCGFVTAADIGLSNLSLVRISITFFTMVKSSSPVWVLLSGFVFGIFPITSTLVAVGLLITTGEVLTAFGEVEFDLIGFLMVGSAAVCGGIRWTLIQLKLQKLEPPLGGPVVTMRVLSSTMFFSMLALSLIIEEPWIALDPEKTEYFSDWENGLKTLFLGLVGAFIAIAMVLCEFWLILKADAIVLMIGGVLKEMITIFVGVTFFGDNLNVINVSGIIVVFLGIFLYKVTLHISKTQQQGDTDGDVETTAHVAPIKYRDLYEDEPLNGNGRDKHSVPVSANFAIEDDDIDDGLIMAGSSSLLGGGNNIAFGYEDEEDENLGEIT